MSVYTIDARGLRCPLPLLRARKALAELAPSEQLVVQVSDLGAPADFAAYCAQSGHQLIEVIPGDEPAVCTIVLARGEN